MEGADHKKNRIDWPNHIIAFFSALFGILIAFQLDEWRERSSQYKLAEEAFRLVRNETSLNKNILLENIHHNDSSLKSLASLLTFVNDDLQFKGTYRKADSINRNNSLVKIMTRDSDKTKKGLLIVSLHITMDQIETPDVHSSAWESAKATGALNYMSLEKVDLLSLIYNNSKLKEELADLRHILKRSDDVKNKAEFRNILTELQRSNGVINRELAIFERYVSMLENIE